MMRNGVIGSTADSDSVSRGSSPFSVAKESRKRFLFLHYNQEEIAYEINF